jgi:hypothetical protein
MTRLSSEVFTVVNVDVTADWDVTSYCLVSKKVSEEYGVIFKVEGSIILT